MIAERPPQMLRPARTTPNLCHCSAQCTSETPGLQGGSGNQRPTTEFDNLRSRRTGANGGRKIYIRECRR